MKPLWISILVLFLISAAFADSPALDKPDPRLDKKVSLEVNHAKLEDVVKQLSDQSGVVIKAGSGKLDWRVKERRVTIQAKDVRLRTLLDEISELLGYHVSRSGKEGEWTYLYWQDLKSRILEREIRAAGKKVAAEHIRKMRGEDTIAAAENALKLSPEGAMKKRKTDPMTAYLGGTKSGRGIANLLSYINRAFPIECDLMLRGKAVSIPISGFPPAMQQAITDALSGGLAAVIHDPDLDLANLVLNKIVITPIDEIHDTEALMMGVGGFMGFAGNPGNRDMKDLFPLCSSDSKMSKLIAEALISLEEGKDYNQSMEQLYKTMEAPGFLAESIARESKTEKNPPTDPELTREVELGQVSTAQWEFRNELQDKAEDVAAWMEELSKTFERPIVLESFNLLPTPGLHVKPGKQPLYKILIGLEKAGYTWEYEEGMFRIRPQDWVLLRSYQIPESFVAYYEKLLEKQGSFALDDLISANASLTDDQADHYYEELDSVLVPTLHVPDHKGRMFLRLYGLLSSQQRKMLATKEDIPFGSLSDRQWQVVSDMIVNEIGDVYATDGGVSMDVRHAGDPESGDDQPQPPTSEEEKIQQDITQYNYHLKVLVAGEEIPRSIDGDIRILGPKLVALVKKNRQEREKQQAGGRQDD